MMSHIPLTLATDNPGSDAARALLDTIAELTRIIAEENRSLAQGFPAGLSATSERKTELAAEYAELWAELGADGVGLLADDPDFAHVLMDAVSRLRHTTRENLARLEAAVTASRRRVEAVLDALRQDARAGSSYGVKGDIALELRLPPAGMNFHA